MKGITKVVKQVLVVSLAAALASYLGASVALQAGKKPNIQPSIYQLVDDPKPCPHNC